MAVIFAIIAIIRQAIFAIVAIYFFAKIANTKDMKDLEFQNKVWLHRLLQAVEHGDKGMIAEKAGIDGTKLSRMANIDPQAKPKNNIKKIPADVLAKLAGYFKSVPPSMIVARERPLPEPRGGLEIVRVPRLDRVAAGKLKTPISQIPVEDVPLLAFADLGRGDFFALTVEGDSMDRLAPDGATIVVDRADRTLVAGKPYVVSDRGEASFKIWKPAPPRFAPSSTNPVHEPIYVKTKEAAEKMVVGRVKRSVVDL